MANFQPKSFPQIVASMAAKVSAETPITDFSDGSVILTLLEAAAQEDFQQYIQMLNVIRNYNLDTTEGEDLDSRAQEFGLTRRAAVPHSGPVKIVDTSFTKIATKLYAGLSGPTAGSIILNVDDASQFPTTGQLYIGRGTANSEGPIAYSSAPVDNGSFWTITLDVALSNDHGTDETVVLAQGGTRTIPAGTEVEVPETDVSDRIAFEINQTQTLLDGEDTLPSVLVTALEPGGFRVPANSIVAFPNPPFNGATVTNEVPFINGKDEETDQQLRDRIRDTIQSLSRGTTQSVKTAIVGLIDQDTNSSVVSANIIPPVNLADGPTKVYIDNGSGLEPSFASVGLEILTERATGGEQFFQLQNFPVVKASLTSQNVEPFALSGSETIIIRVGTNEETFIFATTDFKLPGTVEATEIVEAINNRATIFEARSFVDSSGHKIILTPKARENEEMQIDPSSTAQVALNFSELEVSTIKLYKNDKLLTKDGITAGVISEAQPFNLAGTTVVTTDGDLTVTPGSRIVTKAVSGTEPLLQLVHPGDYVKFGADADAAYRRVETVVSNTKFILEEPYQNTGGGLGNISIWNSPQLEVVANGHEEDGEIVSFGPNDFSTASQALASEVFARVQQEINLSKSELVVNNTKIQFVSDLENSVDSKMQVTGGGAAVALGFCSTAPLTGTLSFTGGAVTVTGSGTLFLTELQEGQWIKVSSHNTGAWTKIRTIESNTILYLEEGYRGANAAGAVASKINPGTLSSGKNKDYTFNRSNGQIELNVPLVAGDSLTAGSINTRAFSDSLPEVFDFSTLGLTSDLIVAVDGGFKGTVTTGDAVAPYDTFVDTNLIGYEAGLFVDFYLVWTSGNNIGQNARVLTYNETTGQITTDVGFTNPILVSDKFTLAQVVVFDNVSDFANPVQGTADEVVAVVNAQLLGGRAEKLITNRVRIRTANLSPEGMIQILGGTANQVLGFPLTEASNQLTNIAFLRSQNNDRAGNPDAIGYTLGPNQTLVVIFDNDSLNKTFSINMQVSGVVTTGGTGSFSASATGGNYQADDYFNDFWIYWTSGSNEGSVQKVSDYVGISGDFTVDDIFPNPMANPIANGDEFAIVPRTAENVVRMLNDLKTTTLSIVGNAEAVGISGDSVQVSTKTPGSPGKVFLTGGTANSVGIAIVSVPAGGDINDVTTNSKAGLSKGLYIKLTVDGKVTTGDAAPPFDTFIDTSMIGSIASYFDGMEIEFLTGNNAGHITTIASYNNVTGQIVLTDATQNAILINDTYRINTSAYVVDITGTVAPYTIKFNDASNNPVDVTNFTPSRLAAIRDDNGLNFSTIQVEGVDGYKYYTGLIQKVQWTIDGLDRDIVNYPGIGAAGTQFEVITPVLIKLELTLDVTTDPGISLSSVSDQIKTAVLEYVNSRGVGEDVILSEIIAAAQSVAGVFDVEITNFTDNIVVADGELARLNTADLIVG